MGSRDGRQGCSRLPRGDHPPDGLTDANNHGNIHGGTVMKFADEAGSLAAVKHARQRVVTVGMDRMDFLIPIYVGELVTFRATVNAAWRTSMESACASRPRTR
jgi:acyl-CoA hydrolase